MKPQCANGVHVRYTPNEILRGAQERARYMMSIAESELGDLAVPFLNLLGDYSTHHGILEMGPGMWPSPKPTGQPGWDRPVRRAIVPA
ncbi:MAG: hypothetical protein RL691_1379 [Actinomycetota bacterium]